MRVVVVLVALALFVVACQQDGQQQSVQQQEADTQEEQMATRLTTSDNKNIAFTFFEGPKNGPGAILLHQLSRDRHDYDAFAPKLVDAGYNVISIDVRGHGESSGDWNLFSANDFRQIGLDIAAAKEHLGKQGVDTSRILLIGASFTANAVINYAADDRDVKAVISLSPGLDYRGIKPQNGIPNVPKNTLLVAAEDDDYSVQSVRQLNSMNTETQTKIYPSGGHGYALFAQTTLSDDILTWIEGKV